MRVSALRNLFVVLVALSVLPLVAQDSRPAAPPKAPAPEVGKPLPPWAPGVFDIHQISTGRGNSAFYRFPDGTTMLVDAGAVGDREVIADTDQRPNATRTSGAWIVRYVERAMAPEPPRLDYLVLTHFHPDHMGQVNAMAPPSKSGAFKLAGITEVGEQLAVGTLIDRGFSYQPPPDDVMIKNYRAFVAEESAKGVKAETLRSGHADQIVLRHAPDRYKTFEVRNVAANGVIWTGEGDAVTTIFPPLDTIDKLDWPSENMCSLGLRIRYGKFDFFTGGDMIGIPDAGSPDWQSVETAVARAIGPTDVHIVNHHGSISPASPFFLTTLRSSVIILPAWAPTHPSQDSLKRMLTMRLYPGPHDIFVTTLREPTKASIGFRVDQIKSTHGHVVVRVASGGDSYRVFVLDDTSEEALVTGVWGPYASK